MTALSPESLAQHRPAPTRDAYTELAYANTALGLQARAARSKGVDVIELSIPDFVDWLLLQQPTWSFATWRLYRASVVFWLSQQQDRGGDDSIYESAINKLRSSGEANCKPTRSEATPPQDVASKGVPVASFEAFLARVEMVSHYGESRMRNFWLQRGLLFMLAGIVTGARPVEWEMASMTGTGVRFFGAKTTNGRGREQRFVSLDGENYQIVAAHVAMVSEWVRGGHDYHVYYREIRRYIYSESKWLKSNGFVGFNPYSARHQFSANQKLHNPIDVVAMAMGHGSIHTTIKHYASKLAAWKDGEGDFAGRVASVVGVAGRSAS